MVMMHAARQGFIKHQHIKGTKKLAWICIKPFSISRCDDTLIIVPGLS